MRIALIADVFPPLRSSGAVQLRDLAAELARQGHEITMMVASPQLSEPSRVEHWQGVRIARFRTPRSKDVGYLRRTVGELLMPFLMLRQLRRSDLRDTRWDGIIWYSPTIFLGPMVSALKAASGCRSYLIVRDIFPEWAVDMGIMGRGLPYRFFKAIAKYQYSVANVIGIQTPGNEAFFHEWRQAGGRVEILYNWLAIAPHRGCSIVVAKTPLAGRKIIVYAGNMGIAQGMGILLDLAECLLDRPDVGFLFVGRGSNVASLRAEADRRVLDNTLFFDEIDPDEIPGLYSQCHIGLVALDPRHRTHNIPGKFLSYMQAGLPVVASINQGNDLVGLIQSQQVGYVCTDGTLEGLDAATRRLLADIESDGHFAVRCRSLSERMFSAEGAARQIVAALQA